MPISVFEQVMIIERHRTSLFINHIHDIFGLVDPTIIHHDDRPGARELIHLVQKATDKPFEIFRVIGALNNIQGDNPVKS